MANSKDKFQKAIRESLEQLQNSGEKKITKTKIINNAKFEDGSSVGKTTLYAKNTITKEYIHAQLLEELDNKIANIITDKPKIKDEKSSEEIIEDLKIKNKKLLAQFVEMEDSFENTVHRNDENEIQNLEINLYIVSFLLNQQIGRGYKELNNIIKKIEVKYHGTEVLKSAKEQIQKMKNDIECSKITPIFGRSTDS